MSHPKRVVRCPKCAATFDEEAILDATVCPSCKTEVSPQYQDHDVTVLLNWEDARLLANWAMNWARETFPEDHLALMELEVALEKLRKVRPPNSEALTLVDLIHEAKKAGLELNPKVVDAVEAEPAIAPKKPPKGRKKPSGGVLH